MTIKRDACDNVYVTISSKKKVNKNIRYVRLFHER